MQVQLFNSKLEVKIDNDKCDKCLICVKLCPTKAIYLEKDELEVNQELCINCYGCVVVCPRKAIAIKRIDSVLRYCTLTI